ncbi:MAG: toll/interleukin-1 receptor domain-containing protein [Hyphomonadaceae bacterium]|nr:toll/interleukin-1 receptor domain-containing protein [Hyphomonadaceae bacterium]
MADVFISYKREDRGAIEQLTRALRGLKLDVWFDASLSAGETFSEEINREARAAKSIVVCWSPAARESRWVLAEALIGFEGDKLAATLVNAPEPFVAPAPFNIVHVEDIRAWLAKPDNADQAWRSLVRRIGKLCGRPELESGAALDAPPPVPRVTDVFAEAKPTYTFIDRSTKPEFRRIQRELLAGGKIIRLHGPSKSGKTELCRQIFKEASPILLYGSQIKSVEAYWGAIATQLGVSVTDAPFACAREGRALIIDNFHDVDRKLQGPIIKSFRPFMDEKGTVVLISVPDVAEVFLEVKRGQAAPDPVIGELLARSLPEEAPRWTEAEIRRIADIGFRTLK